MISRVAESCFWLNRHLERVEVLARILDVNLAFQLDVDLRDAERWRPIVVVSGQELDYLERTPSGQIDDPEVAQEYLAWSADNPSSLVSSLESARENARTIRETISLEMWESLNDLWLWTRERDARRLYGSDRHAFYVQLRDRCQLLHGIAESTLLHEEPFWFMRLGTTLERASQTARMLDLKYHSIGPRVGEIEMPAEAAQWLATLRFCCAIEPFFKRDFEELSGQAIAHFLLFDPGFPRSVLCTLQRATNLLIMIRQGSGPVGERTGEMLGGMLRRLEAMSGEGTAGDDLHATLTWVVQTTAEVCDAVRTDFFDPAPVAPRRRPGTAAQTQA